MLKAAAALLLLVTCIGTAAADEAKVWKIGFVSWFGPAAGQQYLDAVREGLQALGYSESKNIEIEPYFFTGDREAMRDAMRALVQKPVDILVVSATPAAHLAKETTTTIPIVMAPVADPLATGLAQSLAHPGGNITGLSALNPDLESKRLQYLLEMRPSIRSIAFLGSSKDPNAATFVRETKAAADSVGVKLLLRPVDGPDAIDEAIFAAMKRDGAEAIIVQPIFSGIAKKIVALAMKLQLPVAASYAVWAENGALITYGVNTDTFLRRAAYYIDRILKGAKPGDLPIEQPTQFELVINARTAKALGWTVPQSLLLRADRVIE